VFKYQDLTPDAPTRAWQPRVSCLVAVKNEYEVIDRCIASLLATGYPDVEVIVVDDASTDGTRDRLIELEREHQPLRLLLLPESVKKKKALTHGMKYATGEILLFTDSDCVLAPDAVERVVDAFAARPDVGAVSGDVRALNGDRNFLTKMQDAWYDGQFPIWKAAESAFGAVTCNSGPLAAFRREAVDNFFPAWAEDTFLGKEFPFATDRQLTGYLLGNDSIGPTLKRKYADSSFVREEDYARLALSWSRRAEPTRYRFLSRVSAALRRNQSASSTIATNFNRPRRTQRNAGAMARSGLERIAVLLEEIEGRRELEARRSTSHRWRRRYWTAPSPRIGRGEIGGDPYEHKGFHDLPVSGACDGDGRRVASPDGEGAWRMSPSRTTKARRSRRGDEALAYA